MYRERDVCAYLSLYVCVYIYIYIYIDRSAPAIPCMRGWWSTVEMVLFGISSSTKPYPSVFHAYAGTVGPAIVCCFEPGNLD